MKRFSILMVFAAICCCSALLARISAADAPDGSAVSQNDAPGGGMDPMDGPPPRPKPGIHIIPPFAMRKLHLTDDQKEKIADLEKDVKTKLAAILTADQMTTLENARPPRRGGPDGPDDMGGPGGGGPDGGGPDNADGPAPQ